MALSAAPEERDLCPATTSYFGIGIAYLRFRTLCLSGGSDDGITYNVSSC